MTINRVTLPLSLGTRSVRTSPQTFSEHIDRARRETAGAVSLGGWVVAVVEVVGAGVG